MTDQELDRRCMDRLRAGDPKALEELYDRHTPLLYGMVLRIVGRAPDAEEVLQDAWIKVWRSAETWDPERGSVVAWLLTLARSRAIDRLRSAASRSRAEGASGGEETMAAAPEPAASAAHRELHERVVSALGELGSKQREVLELAYFAGLSQSEIASRVGAPLGTVKSWTRQGLMRLRALVPREEPA
ncbi:MAG TPA: sigma-70 family RNA polymerase sigma factor [Candidatus Eisenbacteria bacterium]|jgi:RNA polymerase sigma-70 factor (ECF subfamily)